MMVEMSGCCGDVVVVVVVADDDDVGCLDLSGASDTRFC